MRGNKPFVSLLLSALLTPAMTTAADENARATYLANEGVLIARGETKILFDPLFDNAFGQYQLLPRDMEKKLLAGDAPFDGVDAVFVSHAHGDHFSSALMLAYLRAQTGVTLYAPMQAVTALRRDSEDGDSGIFDRVIGLAIEVGDPAVEFEQNGISINAVRIPHSGWPNRMTDIENLAFRVTLDEELTVVHLGDADPSLDHFRRQSDYWRRRQTDLALPPYWFFLSDEGEAVLADEIRPGLAVGVHVPEQMPDDPADRPAEVQGYDLFTEPGEYREIPPAQ